MKYYYKDKNNNYYSFKSQQGTPIYENDEIVGYKTDLITITEEEFNHHLSVQTAPKYSKEYYNAQTEMTQIKKWLFDNDYLINKHLLGELSEERWNEYLENRKNKLARYNQLEKEK